MAIKKFTIKKVTPKLKKLPKLMMKQKDMDKMYKKHMNETPEYAKPQKKKILKRRKMYR